ncbi:MAG TPA: thermonuclease family protein [Gammaproteobacteria bacterium]|nr:thermonuclease family protein [Gammaproteobacteria bacterium]
MLYRAIAILACCVCCASAQEKDFTARVIGIVDGDTLTVLNSQQSQIRIRLAEIDAPEDGQPYGNRSRQVLSELTFGKDIVVRYLDTDRYGRTVARLFADDLDISAEMLRRGAAWAYQEYVEDTRLFQVEAEARNAHRGLWGISEARVPPWEWRRRTPGATADTPGASFTCGTKVYCGDMVNCAEALFYLNECGVTRLDGDDDGMPCEAICRN